MNSNQNRGGKASSWMFSSLHGIRFSRVLGTPQNASLDGWETNIVLDPRKLTAHLEHLLDAPPSASRGPQYALLDGVPQLDSSVLI